MHSQLQKHHSVDMGFMKEYHVWDSIFSEYCKHFIATKRKGEHCQRALRRLMQSVDGVYENYFAQLIDETVRWTGDITPSYAILKKEHFVHIKTKLESAGFLVKVVFLMRDPVERIWSALRMSQRNNSTKGQTISDNDLLNMFENYYKSPEVELRTRYNLTTQALRESFDEKDLYVGFYEELFSKQSLKNLSSFIGLDLGYADTNEKINASKPATLPKQLRKSCRNYFSDVYSYCNREHPSTKTLWKDYEPNEE